MEDSKRIAVDNGKYYILWGILVSLGIIGNYILISLDTREGRYYMYMWFILVVGGFAATTIMKMKEIKKAKVYTFAGKILSSLWLAGGITMSMVAFVGPAFNAYHYVYINPIISLVLGVTYYVSGVIQQIKWLQLISLGWWAGAIVLFAFPGIHSYLLFGLMIVFLQTIPGIVMYRKWKKEMKVLGESE
jgi:hypothetical protein